LREDAPRREDGAQAPPVEDEQGARHRGVPRVRRLPDRFLAEPADRARARDPRGEHARRRRADVGGAQGQVRGRRMGEGLSPGRVNRGVAWGALASSAVGALDVLATAILLRTFVSQEQYGVATLATMLFTALDLATDLGLSSAVIQRDDHSPEKISTVFWLNVAMSVALAGVLRVAGPVYAAWQGQPVVGAMLAAYGGKLVLQNAYYMPTAMMRRELRFRELAVIRIVSNAVEFAAKIGFAAAGFPIWCFVLA